MSCLPGSSVVEVTVTSFKRTYTRCTSQDYCCQSLCLHGRPLLTHASNGYIQTLKGRSGSVSLGAAVSCCTCSVCALQVSLEGMRFVSKRDFTSPAVLLGFSFALGCKVSFFYENQHSPVDVCSPSSCNFGFITDEYISFYSSILMSTLNMYSGVNEITTRMLTS